MADPLSIAGLATSVISLGLQVAGGLSDYLDAVKGRPEELRSAKQQTTHMKDLILTVQDLLPQVKTSWPTSATSIECHVQSCNAEISALSALLSELSQPASSSSGIRLKLAEQKQKLTYPFNRTHLRHLEERLVKVNNALQTALHVTGLDVSITTRNELRQVHDSAITTKNQVQQLHSISTTTRNELQQMHSISITTSDQVQQTHDVAITTLDEIRQIRDDVRVMCQLTTPRTQSTADCLSSTASGIPQTIVKGGTGVPLDSVEAAVSLASKPSLLSTSMETLTKYRNGSSACFCWSSRKISHHRKTWGCFSFSYETLITQKHLPSCPLSPIHGDKQATKFAVEYNGLKRLVQTAFVLSFVDSRGAGGGSIGPNFTYYPSVDENISPAFRMLALVFSTTSVRLNYNVRAEILQRCFDNILILYRRGRASPRDINSNGKSIMYPVIDIIDRDPSFDYRRVTDSIFSGLTKLIECGVPLATYDRVERTPCGYLLQVASPKFCGTRIAEGASLLLPTAPDIPLIQALKFPRSPVYNINILNQNLKVAEAAGCGPLSLATIAGDERLVRKILRQHPKSLEEVNQFGHTPMYFAVEHPSILDIMLKAGGSSAVQFSDAREPRPLEFACRNGHIREAIRLLIASGSRVRLRYLSSVHESCRYEIFVALKQRRDELKQIALEYLTSTEAESLGLHEDTVLDANAFQTQTLLRRRGVNIPPRLVVEQSYYSGVYGTQFWQGRLAPSIFDQLWALGFQDINSLDPARLLRLLCNPNLDVVRWLIEHGANYWKLFNGSNVGPRIITDSGTPADFIFANIGTSLLYPIPSKYLEARQWLTEKLLQVRVRGTCSCPCSVSGCIPLKALFDKIPFPDDRRIQKNCVWEWVKFIRAFDASLNKDDLVSLVRIGEAPYSECKEMRYDSEEIDEINSEQSSLLSLFADLVDEFKQVAFEDQGGGEPLIVGDAEEFWIRRWFPRITETLDNLDGDDLTQEEISAAEAIGVVWGPQPIQTTAPEDDMPLRDSPEWVMSEMEKIMNE